MGEVPLSEQPEQELKVEIRPYSEEHKEQIKKLIFDVYDREIGQHSESGRPDLERIPEIYQKMTVIFGWHLTKKK